jgi:crossover junction endodeoxyribonuclease RusA
MPWTTFTIHGEPAPQGSKRHVGRGILIESSKKVKPWREAVKWAVLETGAATIEGPVELRLRFLLQRPKGHYGTGRNAGKVKESSPVFPAVRPDIDKLARSTLDGLGDAGLFSDDSRIVSLALEKRYTDRHPRCEVVVRPAGEST